MTRSLVTLAAAVGVWAAEPGPSPLLGVKRVYVDKLGGNESADQIRDMIINALQSSALFVVTENAERADAMLKGSAEDMVFTDTFQSNDSVRANASLGTGSTTRSSGSRRGSMSVGVSEDDSVKIAERKHEAIAAVRLVSKDGDVIWATTQESLGAKFRGASADVADRIVKKLMADLEVERRKVQ